MMGEKTTPKYSPEVRASAVHAVPGHRGNYPSLCGTYRVDCPEDLLCPANLARVGAQARGRYQPASWCDVRRTRTHQGLGARSQGDLQGQRDPEAVECAFHPGGVRPPTQVLNAFLDRHHDTSGLESIGKVCRLPLPGIDAIPPGSATLGLPRARAQRDAVPRTEIQRAWDANIRSTGPTRCGAS